MKGRIKTYLPEKRYGFIIGDDGKDYFFHASDFAGRTVESGLCEEAMVDFSQKATPKGYRAYLCKLLSPERVDTFVVPEHILLTKHRDIGGWEILERSDWIVSGSSSDSPDAARASVKEAAEVIGANAVLDLEYWKTTGENGNYKYSIHNFKGRAAIIARRNSLGLHRYRNLIGLNDRAARLKTLTKEKTDKINRGRSLQRYLAAISGFAVLFYFPAVCWVFFIVAYFLGRKVDYTIWLQYAPVPKSGLSRKPTLPSRLAIQNAEVE